MPERETSSADLLREALEPAGLTLNSNQVKDILDSFHEQVASHFKPLAGVLETLPLLQQAGYRLAVVSNNLWTHSIIASFRHYQIENMFEHVIASCDVGIRKPHPAIYEELLKRMDLKPADVLFVGDSYPHDIRTPKQLGFSTCLVDLETGDDLVVPEYASEANFVLKKFEELLPCLAASR